MTTTTVSTQSEQGAPLVTPSPGLISSRPLQGILLLVGATLMFACGDATSKYLLTDYNVPLVLAIRYIVHSLLMLAILAPTRGRKIVQTQRTVVPGLVADPRNDPVEIGNLFHRRRSQFR